MEPAAFNRKLIPWLLRYNGEGPHCREVLQLSKSGQRTICRVDRKRSKSRLFAILGFLPFRIPACIVPILSWNVLFIWTQCSNQRNPRLITPASRLKYRLSERKKMEIPTKSDRKGPETCRILRGV